jgi:hypothetical protein
LQLAKEVLSGPLVVLASKKKELHKTDEEVEIIKQ